MKVLCCGGWGYGNLGDEFILRGTLVGIQTVLPEAQVTVMSFDPEQTRLWHCIDVVPSLHRLYAGKNAKYGEIGLPNVGVANAWLSFWLSEHKKHVPLRTLAQQICSGYDVIIQAGGGYFNDLFFSGFPGFAFELLGALHSKAPVAMIGQTVGPFHRPNKMRVGHILRQVPLIFVRDEVSIRIMDRLGVHSAKRCADTALLVDTSHCSLRSPKKPHIVIFVCPSLWHLSGSGMLGKAMSRKQMTDTLARVLSEIARAANVDILITASVFWSICWAECKRLAKLIVGRYKYKNVQVVKPRSPSDVLNALNGAILCISMNMHPLILASMLGISCIGISYGWKIDEFMNESKQTRQVIHPNVAAQKFEDLLRKRILDLLSSPYDERLIVDRAVAQLKVDALAPFKFLASYVYKQR